MAREIKFSLLYRDMWQSSGKYVPCVYSFVYGNTYFLSMNSEITEDSKVDIFGDIEGENVYTELEAWCLSDLASHASDLSIKWKVAYTHESPFTIITQASIDTYLVSGAGGYTKKLPYERGGSRLNTIGSYWFSKFLQTMILNYVYVDTNIHILILDICVKMKQ